MYYDSNKSSTLTKPTESTEPAEYDTIIQDNKTLRVDDFLTHFKDIPNIEKYVRQVLLVSILSDIIYYDCDIVNDSIILAILGVKLLFCLDTNNTIIELSNIMERKPKVAFFCKISVKEREHLLDNYDPNWNKFTLKYRKQLIKFKELYELKQGNYEILREIKRLKMDIVNNKNYIDYNTPIYSDELVELIYYLFYKSIDYLDERDIFVIFKGSQYITDWTHTNLDRGFFSLTNTNNTLLSVDTNSHFYPGIMNNYLYIRDQLLDIFKTYQNHNRIIFGGHSKGGGEAKMACYDICTNCKKLFPDMVGISVGLITFAAPDIGNITVAKQFYNYLKNKNEPLEFSLNFNNELDMARFSTKSSITYYPYISGINYINSNDMNKTITTKYIEFSSDQDSYHNEHKTGLYINNCLVQLLQIPVEFHWSNIYNCLITEQPELKKIYDNYITRDKTHDKNCI